MLAAINPIITYADPLLPTAAPIASEALSKGATVSILKDGMQIDFTNMNAPYSPEYLAGQIEDKREEISSGQPGSVLEMWMNIAKNKNNEDTAEDEPFTFTIQKIPPGLKKLSSLDPMNYAEPFKQMNGDVEKETQSLVRSYYNMLSMFAVAGLVFSFIFAGIKLMTLGIFTRSSSKEEIVSALGSKIIAFGLFCSIVLFVRVVGDVVAMFI